MADYPKREFIVRETGYPGATKQEVVGELVRCKDCTFWGIFNVLCPNIGICCLYRNLRHDYDYCSRGERKNK